MAVRLVHNVDVHTCIFTFKHEGRILNCIDCASMLNSSCFKPINILLEVSMNVSGIITVG